MSELRHCSDSSEALARCSVFTLLVCFRLLVISDLGFALYWFFFFFFLRIRGLYLCNLLGLLCAWFCYNFFFFFSDFSFFFGLKVVFFLFNLKVFLLL